MSYGYKLAKLSLELINFKVNKLKGYSDNYKQGFMDCKVYIRNKINKILESE